MDFMGILGALTSQLAQSMGQSIISDLFGTKVPAQEPLGTALPPGDSVDAAEMAAVAKQNENRGGFGVHIDMGTLLEDDISQDPMNDDVAEAIIRRVQMGQPIQIEDLIAPRVPYTGEVRHPQILKDPSKTAKLFTRG